MAVKNCPACQSDKTAKTFFAGSGKAGGVILVFFAVYNLTRIPEYGVVFALWPLFLFVGGVLAFIQKPFKCKACGEKFK